MKTGDWINRYTAWGVALDTGAIRPAKTRKAAREIVLMYANFGKTARVIENVRSDGTVTR